MDFSELKQLQEQQKGKQQLEEARYRAPPTFVTGDHVHEKKYVHHWSPYRPGASVKQYGVVISHGPNSAKVKFENGEEATFKHNGEMRGSTGEYSPRTISHNYIDVTDENGRKHNKKVSNEEHKASVEAEKQQMANDHEAKHKGILADLASIPAHKFDREHHEALRNMITKLKG